MNSAHNIYEPLLTYYCSDIGSVHWEILGSIWKRAEQSGIVIDDVIIAIDDHVVNSLSELQEWVARNRPRKKK